LIVKQAIFGLCKSSSNPFLEPTSTKPLKGLELTTDRYPPITSQTHLTPLPENKLKQTLRFPQSL